MSDLILNVCVTVTKNQSNYFIEDIKVHNNLPTKFKFEYEDQSIQYHKTFEKLINKKKGKQLIYTSLTGEDLNFYYDIKNQKFIFNNKELKELNSVDSKYNLNEHQEEFLKRFNSKYSKKEDAVKLNLLLQSIEECYIKELSTIELIQNGYDYFIDQFKKIFTKKHREHGKELFNF